MSALVDRSNSRYGMLTARVRALRPASLAENPGKEPAYWQCDCDCGGSRIVSAAVLRESERTGHPLSCGCLRRAHLFSIRGKGAKARWSKHHA